MPVPYSGSDVSKEFGREGGGVARCLGRSDRGIAFSFFFLTLLMPTMFVSHVSRHAFVYA